ncbi:unnamed protein product [Dracunculus medinensis]|uniref:ShKT domain-containing protein n=1 Tax=Dracunculus medinensis TaxID=318479 RepID=A0A0N4USA4_DRAME|nr:unnamed protein product [Dracunculus medinensis]
MKRSLISVGGREGPCRNFSRSLCTSIPDFALRFCPQTCGLCHLPGAANMCPDIIDGCDVLVPLEAYILSWILATTLSSPTQNCKDERQGCEAIRASNSCGGVFRTTMMQQCARTCGYLIEFNFFLNYLSYFSDKEI